jgi:glycosyltransferase involved in cell wall biosynthesis
VRGQVKVLMLGPGTGVTGGIAGLVQAILPELRQRSDVLYVPTVDGRPLKESGRLSLRNLLNAASQYGRYLDGMLRFRPDLVHVHTSQGLGWLKDTLFVVAAKALHCGVLVHMHGGSFDRFHDGSSRAVQRYTCAVLARADAVIAVSDDLRRRVAHIVPPDRTTTLRNCIDAASIVPTARRGDGPVRALFIGTLGRSKGAYDLLDALSVLRARGRSTRAWIAGYEEDRGDLGRVRERARALGLAEHCEIVGPVGPAEKQRLLGQANVFVLPSYAEGLPMAVLEGMAAGLAIVATTVGGIPEAVEDGQNGFLVPPGRVEELVEKLDILEANPAVRSAMGTRSRELAEGVLDARRYVDRLVALYETLLAPARGS